ncbi:hypothetical protein YC2023_102800 [Brassica napus]
MLYYDSPTNGDLEIVSRGFQKLEKVASTKCKIQVIFDEISFSSTVYSTSSTVGLVFFKNTFLVEDKITIWANYSQLIRRRLPLEYTSRHIDLSHSLTATIEEKQTLLFILKVPPTTTTTHIFLWFSPAKNLKGNLSRM